MKYFLLLSFLLIANLSTAVIPISVASQNQEISTEQSASKLLTWWKTAKINIIAISKWTFAIGALAGPVLIIAILADVALIGYIGIGLMFLSLILGCIVLFNRDKAVEGFKKSKLRAKLGMLLALLPIIIGIIFVLTFSL